MLRKSLVAVLLALYSLSAIGMPLHFHYCKGELKHVTLLVQKGCHVEEAPVHACCKGSKPHCDATDGQNSCCDDDIHWLQDNEPTVCASALAFQDLSEVQIGISTLPEIDEITKEQVCSADFNPGHGSDPPLFLLHCSLIYYG
jgi:hypothetical protein